jgi:chromosome segregation ATPase
VVDRFNARAGDVALERINLRKEIHKLRDEKKDYWDHHDAARDASETINLLKQEISQVESRIEGLKKRLENAGENPEQLKLRFESLKCEFAQASDRHQRLVQATKNSPNQTNLQNWQTYADLQSSTISDLRQRIVESREIAESLTEERNEKVRALQKKTRYPTKKQVAPIDEIKKRKVAEIRRCEDLEASLRTAQVRLQNSVDPLQKLTSLIGTEQEGVDDSKDDLDQLHQQYNDLSFKANTPNPLFSQLGKAIQTETAKLVPLNASLKVAEKKLSDEQWHVDYYNKGDDIAKRTNRISTIAFVLGDQARTRGRRRTGTQYGGAGP